jgi:hypothetical protein
MHRHRHRRPAPRRRSLPTRLIGVLAILVVAATPAASQATVSSMAKRPATSADSPSETLASPPRAWSGSQPAPASRATRAGASAKKAPAGGSAATVPVAPSDTKFGVTVQPRSGVSYASAYAAANNLNGGLESYRLFYPGGPRQPGAAGYGRIPVIVSFRYQPRDVLSGKHDAELAAWFRGASHAFPIYWVYSHEPENDIERHQFAATDYRAAWSHIRKIQRSTGRMDMKATLVLMCYTLNPISHRNWRDYYPGGDVIDVMAWDCYNWGQDASKPFYAPAADLFHNAVALSASLGKPFGIAETASPRVSGDGSGYGRAAWLRSLAAYLSQKHALFVCYFDVQKPGSIDFRLTDAPSRAAWRAIVSA